MSTTGRLLDVSAFTTLDFVDASARGPTWTDDAPAVVDVQRSDEDAVGVVLALELDGTSLDHVEHHADHVHLTRDQARTLADALSAAADSDGADGPGGRRGR